MLISYLTELFCFAITAVYVLVYYNCLCGLFLYALHLSLPEPTTCHNTLPMFQLQFQFTATHRITDVLSRTQEH
jgi:hypothetical protein